MRTHKHRKIKSKIGKYTRILIQPPSERHGYDMHLLCLLSLFLLAPSLTKTLYSNHTSQHVGHEIDFVEQRRGRKSNHNANFMPTM
eukprot:1410702-Amphidinium_carterae.1